MNFRSTWTFWAAFSWPHWEQESQPRNISEQRFRESTTCGYCTRGFVEMKWTIKRWWVSFTSVLFDLRHSNIAPPEVVVDLPKTPWLSTTVQNLHVGLAGDPKFPPVVTEIKCTVRSLAAGSITNTRWRCAFPGSSSLFEPWLSGSVRNCSQFNNLSVRCWCGIRKMCTGKSVFAAKVHSLLEINHFTIFGAWLFSQF